MKKYTVPFLVVCSVAVLFAGCSRGPADYTAKFEPNLVHAMKYQIQEGISFEEALQDADWIVDGMFGTPDEPTLPDLLKTEDFADLISLDRIKKAAGPFGEGSGLYRKHCVSCHGITGNGRGENSAILDPYPRDYRLGIFKFKSTKRGAKPLREDLARSIRNGIDGTAMKKIPDLSEDDVQALVDYVIYLSIRGQVERALIDDAVNELDVSAGDRVVDRQFGDSIAGDGRAEVEKQAEAWTKEFEAQEEKLADKSEEEQEAGLKALNDDPRAKMAKSLELYDEAMEYASDHLEEIASSWLDAEDEVVEVPEPPAGVPVANNFAEFQKLATGDQAEAMAASIKRGQELFTGKIAACSKCHGEKGLGDGQNKDYDDWTKDWTSLVGLKPEDTESLIPLMARGAMPPKNALPRNFSEGVFRGGESAADLYRRISQGIEGSPMPAATFVPGEYEQDDIWHLINFVRSLKKVEPAEAI
ncbi:MAG: c-type cytochrome [Planctomycetales bacterium]|nr:c-type cytochrome [Planctomycetales bacterium]